MANDTKNTQTDDENEDFNYHQLDDQQEEAVDISDTDLDNISDAILNAEDEPLSEDEISLSELSEDEDDEENNDLDNLRPGGIDEGTD